MQTGRRNAKRHPPKRVSTRGVGICYGPIGSECNLTGTCRRKQKKHDTSRRKYTWRPCGELEVQLGSMLGKARGNLTVSVTPMSTDLDVVDANPQSLDDDKDSSDDAHPLLIFYDCETTGLSIYSDHITDIAAKVVASPAPLSEPTFSSLVKTSRRIPAPGTQCSLYNVMYMRSFICVLSYQGYWYNREPAQK